MTLRTRRYGGRADYELLRRLFTENLRHTTTHNPMTVGDLDFWVYAGEDGQESLETMQLWFDAAGNIVGFAWPDLGSGAFDIGGHHAHPEVVEEILEWGDGAFRQADDSRTAEGVIEVNAAHGDAVMEEALAAHGYARSDRFSYGFRRALNDAVPLPRLPGGYSIRSFRGVEEIEQRVAVIQAVQPAYGHRLDRYRRMVAEAPAYRQDLDLVVLDPLGEMVACMNLWYDEPNRCGLVEPLGTRDAHRRRGLGSAMYHEGMRRLQGLGAVSVLVNTGHYNAAAKALAESVGFKEVAKIYAWCKPRPVEPSGLSH